MNTKPTQNDPLMELVKKLDPLHNQPKSIGAEDKQAILDRVMGQSASQDSAENEAVNVVSIDDDDRRRNRFALPGVIAASIAVVAMLLFGLFRAPSAEAELVAAAERTARIESGRVEVVVNLFELDETVTGPVDFALHYVFEGDDYRLDMLSQGAVGISNLRVDGVSYLGENLGGPLVWTVRDNSELLDAFLGDFLGGLSAADARPETVLPLIRVADDYQVTRTGNTAVYQGTISRVDLLAQSDLPAGVALVTSGADPESELPETMVLEVTVVDELLQQLVLLVEGDLPTGDFVKATVTTTYSEYDEPQNLVAPVVNATTASPFPQLGDDDTEVVEAVTLPPEAALRYWVPGPPPHTDDEMLIIEMLERRPRLCFDPVPPPPTDIDSSQGFSEDDFRALTVDCLLSSGEPEVAALVDDLVIDDVFGDALPEAVALPPEAFLPFWVPSPGDQSPEAARIFEMLGRRPGLCFNSTTPLDDPDKAAVVDCLRSNGESAVATAVDEMPVGVPSFVIPPPFWASDDPETADELVIAEVLQRRPGLCYDAGWPTNPVPGQRVTDEKIQAGVVDCFANAGEGEAALAASRLPAFDDF